MSKITDKIAYFPNDNHPLSLESERRKAMSIVYSVERDAENFFNKWLRNASDDYVDHLVDYLAVIKDKLEVKKWSSFKEFADNMEKVKEQSITSETMKMYSEMMRIVNRVKHFDTLIENAKRKLRCALEDHVHKYCLSFCYADDSHCVVVAKEYENNINTWRENALRCLRLLHTKYDDYLDTLKEDFEEYVHRYGRVLHLMSEVLEVIPKVCSPLKDWVTADEAYPRKLLDEENKYQKEKGAISEAFRRKQNNSLDRQSKVKRAGFNTKITNEKLQAVLTERRSIRKQELTYKDALGFVNDELEMNRDDLQELMFKLSRRSMHSQGSFSVLASQCDEIQLEIARLEKRAKTISKKLAEIKKDRYRVQKEVHKLKSSFDSSVRMAKRAYDDLDHAERGTQSMQETQRHLAAKACAARSIREIKIHPATVKKVHTYGYTPGLIVDLADQFSEALKLAASGKEWGVVSQRLSVDDADRVRPVGKQCLSLDMERGMRRKVDKDSGYLGAKSLQKNWYPDTATRGMEKWRHVTNDAATRSLVRTLKSIQRQQNPDRQIIVT